MDGVQFENNEIEDNSFSDIGIESAKELDTSKQNEGEEEVIEEGADESTAKDGEEGAVDPKKQSQSPEQNKAFAEMRRKLEAAEKKAREYEELDNRAKEMFKEHGVKSMAEYLNKLQEQQLEARKEELLEKGYDAEEVDKLLKTEKENLELKQKIAAEEKAKRDAFLVSEYNSVVKEYPDLVKSIDDIPDEAWAKFEKGYSLVDAFESVNKAQIKAKEQEKAKQKTLNNLSSKKHLKAEGDGAGEGSATIIDADTMQNYLDMGFTKKQALEYHKKYFEK